MSKTINEALLAEILGDLGKVHDNVNRLVDTMDALPDRAFQLTERCLHGIDSRVEQAILPALERVNHSAGIMEKQTADALAELDIGVVHAQSELNQTILWVKTELKQLCKDSVEDIGRLAADAKKEVSRHSDTIKQNAHDDFSHIFTSIAQNFWETERIKQASLRDGFSWRTLAITALGAAFLAASMTYYGTYRVFTRLLEDKIYAGEAVMSAWGKLDDQAKKIIADSF